ncbi:hypothetical protein CGZ93_03395 [Enemella dayhoffiae]|uniref:Mannosyltransferase PIG-V n=1 Tax=Enemella dayhoffiae TaxID=2016507 RepID=A0A255H9H4_9ACTN|nr:hypothetical protein [Enemella dayhoffiae]OYO24448.1 hypothetical protein CGZ93_03395 [Enemella dayhoffiae]
MTTDTAETAAEQRTPRRSWYHRIDRRKWRLVLLVFLICKLGTFAVAAVAVPIMEYPRQVIAQHETIWPDELREDNFGPVSMWQHFDSEHYVALVDRDYLAPLNAEDRDKVERARAGETFPVNQTLHRFTFGPLYPVLGKVLAPLFGAVGALWLISNLAMLACLALMYDLTRAVFGDRVESAEDEAESGEGSGPGGLAAGVTPARTLTWLVVLPSAFLLQAVLTESLFLALVLGAFTLAERRRWGWVAVLAACFALTRSSGFVLALPLALVALRQGGYSLVRAESWKLYLRAAPAILAAPLAWFGFMLYCRHFTGDLFAYSHLQHAGWGVVAEPPPDFWSALTGEHVSRPMIKAISVLVMGAILLLGVRLIPIAYQVLAWLLLLVPLMIGEKWQQSIWRYAVEVFPMAWVLAHWLRRPRTETAGVAVSSALQGVLLLTWVISWTRMIV